MEFGYLTSRVHAAGGPVRSGILPSGMFMTAEWTGPYERLVEVKRRYDPTNFFRVNQNVKPDAAPVVP